MTDEKGVFFLSSCDEILISSFVKEIEVDRMKSDSCRQRAAIRI